MNKTLHRYQVYLDQSSVRKIDDLADVIRINRSQIIREAVASVGERYTEFAVFLLRKKPKKSTLMELSGIGESRTGHLSENTDEIYDDD